MRLPLYYSGQRGNVKLAAGPVNFSVYDYAPPCEEEDDDG